MQQPYKKLSIIALGETGSGKSLFCKLFSNMNDFVSMRSQKSVTTEIISKTFLNNSKKVEIELIDTPGSNDTRGPNQDINNLKAIKKFLKEQNQRINCIIIVMDSRFERLDQSLKTSIKNICDTFPLPDFWKHVIIFWTH
jgi:GTPase SAR1 family protein